ncbi:MAG: DUF1707 SHOCT-like domain-containing protein [Acidothermaceae bacterium]
MRSTDSLRIGDAERDAAIALLGRHFTDGRLTQEEHEERMALALRARTGGDLRRLFVDLPFIAPIAPSGRRGLHTVRQPIAAVLMATAIVLVAMHLISVLALVAFAFVGSRLIFGSRHMCGRSALPRSREFDHRW